MQCTTKYPTLAEDIGLGWLSRFANRYQCPVGLSDHCGEIFAGLAAVALGAVAIEAHITFDKRMFGPDAVASLTVDKFDELVRGIRFIELARGDGLGKVIDNKKKDLRRMFGKALAVNSDLEKGEVIAFEDLEGKKPADAGMEVNQYVNIVGKKLKTQKKRGDFLTHEDIDID
jgi:N-acetylneuraminate synthase